MAGFQTAAPGRIVWNEKPRTPVVDITLCRPWLAVQEPAQEPELQSWAPPAIAETTSVSLRREMERAASGMPRLEMIIRTVCLVTRVRRMDLLSERRDPPSVKGRQIVCWLAKRDTVLSYPQVARAINRLDHTTVMHGVRRVQSILDHLKLTAPDEIGAAADMLWQLDWPPVKVVSIKH